MSNKIFTVGELLFRYRAIIAIPFFFLLVLFSQPTKPGTFVFIFMIIGLLIRLWAAGYIGNPARHNQFSGEFVIVNGPYRYLKHPLYMGNFFLVLGTIFLFNPPLWFAALLTVLFLSEYLIIISCEDNFLKNLPKKNVSFKLSNVKNELSTYFIITIIFFIYLVRLFMD